MWYTIEALIEAYAGDFDHIGILDISAIETVDNRRFRVEQSGGNPMHASIKGLPENTPENKDSLRLAAEALARITAVVRQSEWVHLIKRD